MHDSPHARMVPDVLQHIPIVRGHQPDDLGHIQRGAAAEADHAVGTVRLEGRGAGHDHRARRVAVDAVEDGDMQLGQLRAELGQHRQRGQSAVGDDQRASAAGIAQMAGNELARAGTEVDRGGEGEAAEAHEQRRNLPASAGLPNCLTVGPSASTVKYGPDGSLIAKNTSWLFGASARSAASNPAGGFCWPK